MTIIPKFTKDDKFSDYLDRAVLDGACVEAIDYCRAKIEPYYATCGEAFTFIKKDPEFQRVWCVWVLKMHYSELDETIRKCCIEKLIDRPQLAFQIYLKIPDLNAVEDLLLEGMFVGKLPRMEQELATGIINRAKQEG